MISTVEIATFYLSMAFFVIETKSTYRPFVATPSLRMPLFEFATPPL